MKCGYPLKIIILYYIYFHFYFTRYLICCTCNVITRKKISEIYKRKKKEKNPNIVTNVLNKISL